mmetsp:Transcript_5458/g.13861  ORF Transcript_5458/g.13861 Transcript_5458/m.13861 type:complete len:232 (-) Transcript_5458:216-911(-)
MTSTKMMTRLVVMSESFFPTRDCEGSGFSGPSILWLLSLILLALLPMDPVSSAQVSSWLIEPEFSSSWLLLLWDQPSSMSSPGARKLVVDRRMSEWSSASAFKHAASTAFFVSKLVLYALYSLTNLMRRMMRTVRPALAPALPALEVRRAPLASSEAQKSALPIQVRSKSSVAVEPTSRAKKKPMKYSAWPKEETMISMVKTMMAMIVRILNIMSIRMCVAASRKSSPKRA